jgi:hypothetical protein
MRTTTKALIAGAVTATVLVHAGLAFAVGVVLGLGYGDAEYRFCQQADSQSYCLQHPDLGDDVRLGA